MRNTSTLSSIFYICVALSKPTSSFTIKTYSHSNHVYRLQAIAPHFDNLIGGISDKNNFDPDEMYVEGKEVTRSRKAYGVGLGKNQALVSVKTHEARKRINRYDLGLGKNKPIGSADKAKESNDDEINDGRKRERERERERERARETTGKLLAQKNNINGASTTIVDSCSISFFVFAFEIVFLFLLNVFGACAHTHTHTHTWQSLSYFCTSGKHSMRKQPPKWRIGAG